MPSANPSSQLMQLCKSKPIRSFNHHNRGVRHIYSYLYDHGRNQQVDLCPSELHHNLVLLGAGHSAMQEFHMELGKNFFG